jgi:hypothetical protein
MDPAVRKLIDQPWPHRRRYEEIGALLPADDAELDGWFAEVVDAMDATGFNVLCIAALGANRSVDGRHLVRGAGLICDGPLLGSIAWHMSGDVAQHLLAATSGDQILPIFRCMALFALAAICQERHGGVYPPELFSRARLLARRSSGMHSTGKAALYGIAEITRDPALAAILKINLEEKRDKAAKLTRTLKEACGKSPLELVVDTPHRQLGQGAPVRRAVARIGRNEPCPCQSGRKYKNCCMAADAERLNDSSHIAGKSQAELRAEPEPYLTLDRLQRSMPCDYVRFDPLKVPPALREDLFVGFFAHSLFDRAIECLEILGFPEDLDQISGDITFFAMLAGRTDVIRKLLAVHPRAAKLQEELSFGVKLALHDDDLGRYLAFLEEGALKALRSDDEGDLHEIAFGILSSKLPALGILVARALIPAVNDESAQNLLEHIAIARDKLGLSVDEPAGDLFEQRLLAKTRVEDAEDSKENRALTEARERLDAKAREVASLRESLEALRRTVKSRESRPEAASPAAKAAQVGPDEQALQDLRFKVQKLKGELKERHEERIALRQALRDAHSKIETAVRELPAAAGVPHDGNTARDPETEHLLPEDPAQVQPVRLPDFPRKFHQTLDELPRHVARNAVATIGRLAAGDLDAFMGVLRLKACPETYRQRIGANHRLLFRLTPDRLVVVDLIDRRDLDRRIKSLIAAG